MALFSGHQARMNLKKKFFGGVFNTENSNPLSYSKIKEDFFFVKF